MPQSATAFGQQAMVDRPPTTASRTGARIGDIASPIPVLATGAGLIVTGVITKFCYQIYLPWMT